MAAFCPCPKNLPKAKLISNRLISLVEAISRKHEIRHMIIFGTSDADLQQQNHWRGKKYKMSSFKRKRTLGSILLQLWIMLEGATRAAPFFVLVF